MKSWENYTIVLILVSLGTWGCLAYGNPTPPKEIPKALTFMISSNTVSNFTPCGCHSGKWGGLPRRGTIFLDVKNSVDWPTLYVDTGDVSQGSTSELQKKKDGYIFMAYKVMDYDAVNVGLSDLGLGYEDLARISAEQGIPWISANTYGPGVWPDLPVNPVSDPPVEESAPAATESAEAAAPQPLFAPYVVVEPEGAPGFKVAIIGMMMQDAGRLNPKKETSSFEPFKEAIQRTVADLRDILKVDLIVLMNDNDNYGSIETAQVFSGIDIVIGGKITLERSPNAALNELNPLYSPSASGSPANSGNPESTDGETPAEGSETESEDAAFPFEPLAGPLMVSKAGGRGRLVTRLDIYLDPNGRIYDYYTEDIEVNDTNVDDERMNEVARLYDTEILSQELLAKVERSFAGSQACEECHPGYTEAWSENSHFESYNTIAESESAGDRDCTRCHAIGFVEEPRLLTYDLIAEKLRNVGCEGCHTNGQRHITLQKQLANLSADARATATTQDAMSVAIDQATCLLCHTGEWGANFDFNASMEAAKQICLSIHPSYVPPPANTTPDTPPQRMPPTGTPEPEGE